VQAHISSLHHPLQVVEELAEELAVQVVRVVRVGQELVVQELVGQVVRVVRVVQELVGQELAQVVQELVVRVGQELVGQELVGQELAQVVQEPVVENRRLLRVTLSQDPVGAIMIMFLPQIIVGRWLEVIPSGNRVMGVGNV
jgi:hypothetical protein